MSPFALTGAPFDLLSPQESAGLLAKSDIAFYPQDAEILGSGVEVTALYVLIKGLVREMAADEEVIAVYRPGDTFDARSLVAGRTRHRFIAHEETLLHVLSKDAVLSLTEGNPQFGAFFFARVADKFAGIAERASRRELQTLLNATVREVVSREPVFLPDSATVLDAARLMKERKIASVLIEQQGRVGIFTSSDFRDVILEGLARETPLAEAAHFELISAELDAYLFDALLTMMRHNVRRIVATEHGKPVGVVRQVDLLNFFASHSHLIAQRIEHAASLPDLDACAAAITRLVESHASQGVKIPALARLVQALNGRLFERTWQFIADPAWAAQSCLVVLGSEGRGEQLLKTDQDNALIFADGADPESVRQAAEAFSRALERFGYPPCPGGVMVNNDAWRGSLSEWKHRLYSWIYQPQSDARMNLAIFIDATAVAGDAELLAECKQYLAEQIQEDVGFLGQFARPINQFDAPGLFAQMLGREHGGLDLKKIGIFPIVHGTRALALERGLTQTNTFERLRKLGQIGPLDAELADDTAEALAFLLRLRLEQGLAALSQGKRASNVVHPERLSSLERDLLKEALAVVKRYRALLSHHFKLSEF